MHLSQEYICGFGFLVSLIFQIRKTLLFKIYLFGNRREFCHKGTTVRFKPQKVAEDSPVTGDL